MQHGRREISNIYRQYQHASLGDATLRKNGTRQQVVVLNIIVEVLNTHYSFLKKRLKGNHALLHENYNGKENHDKVKTMTIENAKFYKPKRLWEGKKYYNGLDQKNVTND